MTRFMMLLVFLGFTGLVVSCGQDAPSSSSAVAGTPLAARKPDVALLPGGEPATPPTGNFVAHCTGGQEVPPVVTPGQGQAKFQFSADGSELSYRLLVTNLEDIVAAHIHIAPAGENGPVVAFLYGGGDIRGAVLGEGVITSGDLLNGLTTLDELREQMLAGNTYVNVHTPENPAGEIRGQIRPAGATP